MPIIFHDRLLDRNTNSSGYTFDYSWTDYLEKIRLNNGEHIPSLEDFCREISQSNKRLYLDVKPLGYERSILDICHKYLDNDQFFIGSFHNHCIKLIKQIDPGVQTIMIMEGNPIDIVQVIENSGCDVVALGFDSIEEDSIYVAQELGKKVFTWVVNDSREIDLAKSYGVDGITSDYPERI